MWRRDPIASTTSSACSRTGRYRSRSVTSSRPCRSATPARPRTSSDPTRTERAGRQRGRSVSRVLCRRRSRVAGDGHPSEAAGHPTAPAADPRAGQRASPPSGHPDRVAPSYLALLRVEFAAFHSAADPEGPLAASSLWHWSSSHDGRALPATLRWGARTFLTTRRGSPRRGPRDHPTASLTPGFYPRQSRPPASRPGSEVVETSVSRTVPVPPRTNCSSMSPTDGA